jgi:hypothetical protein
LFNKPVKTSILKMQQLEIGNSDLGETNFVRRRMIRDTNKKWGGFLKEEPGKSPTLKTQQVL